VEGYVRRLEIPSELVAPLVSMGWAHRAMRQVTRLDTRALSGGHYIGLLRASIDPRFSGAWRSNTFHADGENAS
jgi:hypothetical protein